jgi:hypothetical protein
MNGSRLTAPAVMLSPNATNFVLARTCETCTPTVNVQEACFISASVTVQLTTVSPIGKTLEDPGLQLT